MEGGWIWGRREMGLGMGVGESGETGCDEIYERIYFLKKE